MRGVTLAFEAPLLSFVLIVILFELGSCGVEGVGDA